MLFTHLNYLQPKVYTHSMQLMPAATSVKVCWYIIELHCSSKRDNGQEDINVPIWEAFYQLARYLPTSAGNCAVVI